ncbi:MAG: hypothetical protein Q9190_005202 [Brigantiaea leucoxantha]
MTQPLIRSASKRQFLEALGLNGSDPSTENKYWLMKEEAIRAYQTQLQGRSDLLRPEYKNQVPPYGAAHFTLAAFGATIQLIYADASPTTRPYYNKGRFHGGDNWVIGWMLYHVCRYRDSRNVRANSRNFHDDDDLDVSNGGTLTTRIHGFGKTIPLNRLTGNVAASTNSNQATPNTAFYDPARNGFRR